MWQRWVMVPAPDTSAIRDRLRMWPLVAVVNAVAWWSYEAADADAWLPNPWPAWLAGAVTLWALIDLAAAKRPKTRVIAQALVIVLPSIALLSAEVWLRSADVAIADQRLERTDDALLRFQYRAGAALPEDVDNRPLTVNPHHMWDTTRTVAKSSGVFRIALLGDSVPNDTFVPYEARFHRRLEHLLAERPPRWLGDRAVEVCNFAVEGYNTAQQQRLYEQRVHKFTPDLVLWAYVHNDPFTQDGSYRRIGHSFAAYQLQLGLAQLLGASVCQLLAPLYEARSFQSVVVASFERMALVLDSRKFNRRVPVRVAVLPLVTAFDDPDCATWSNKVRDAALSAGFGVRVLAKDFHTTDAATWQKVGESGDVTHPNATGHAAIAAALHHWLHDDQALAAELGADATETQSD